MNHRENKVTVSLFCSYEMWKESKILLQCSELQQHMSLAVFPWPSLWAAQSSCGGLRLSWRNPPEPRKHVHTKVWVCMLPLWWRNTPGTCGFGRTAVVSWWSTSLINILLYCETDILCLKNWFLTPVVFQSLCKDGELRCSKDCGEIIV